MDSLVFPLRSVFVALPLEEEAKWRFRALQEELKPYGDILRFQNPRSPHLTLQYWPELMEIEYNRIAEQIESIAAKSVPFSVQSTGVSTFGFRGQERVLFLDVAFSPELAALRRLCPWTSGKPFSPHITLARIGHPQRFSVRKKRILKALGDSVFTLPVDRLRLYAEIDGRKQTPITTFTFP